MSEEIHDKTSVCPACEQNISRVELHSLVWTYEYCDCDRDIRPIGTEPHLHLVYTPWHKECYAESCRTVVKEDEDMGGRWTLLSRH